MTWVRIDDHAPSHPKLRGAGADAAWLWVCGLAWCNGHHTDGEIEKTDLMALYDHAFGWSPTRAKRAADRLVKVGLWHDEGRLWRVHNYIFYQDEATKEAQQDRRTYERDRKRKQREAKRLGIPIGVPKIVPDIVPGDSPAGHGAGTVPGTRVPGHPSGTPATDGRSTGPSALSQPPDRPTDRPTDPSLSSEERDRLLSEEHGRWALWLRWRREANHNDDAPIHRDGVERAWQAVERSLAEKIGLSPGEAFERACKLFLGPWKPPTGTVEADRRATHLVKHIHALADAVGGPKPKSSSLDEAARRRALAAQREAKTA